MSTVLVGDRATAAGIALLRTSCLGNSALGAPSATGTSEASEIACRANNTFGGRARGGVGASSTSGTHGSASRVGERTSIARGTQRGGRDSAVEARQTCGTVDCSSQLLSKAGSACLTRRRARRIREATRGTCSALRLSVHGELTRSAGNTFSGCLDTGESARNTRRA